MVRTLAESDRHAWIRLKYQFGRNEANADGFATDVASPIASRAPSDATLAKRKSFGDAIADYNPMGQFGAAWVSRHRL
jgi:hypothetical protein